MSVQSLDRAFDILELLARNRDGMTLAAISAQTALNKSTVHRILGSLRARGYAAQEQNGRYRIGLAFIALTSQYLNRLEIKTEAEPYLRRLSEDLGETVFLAVLRDSEVIYLDKVERFDGLRRYSIIGQRAPVHCTSLGKALILDKSDEDIRQLLHRPMERFTPNTITDPNAFIEEIQILRGQGWTCDREEYEPGVSCVGVPVRDYRGQIIAAISSAWERKNHFARTESLVRSMKHAADLISRQLGYIVSDRQEEHL